MKKTESKQKNGKKQEALFCGEIITNVRHAGEAIKFMFITESLSDLEVLIKKII